LKLNALWPYLVLSTFLVLLDQLVKGQVQFSMGLAQNSRVISGIDYLFLFFYIWIFLGGLLRFWKIALTPKKFVKFGFSFLIAAGFSQSLDLFWMGEVFRHLDVYFVPIKVNLADIYLLISLISFKYYF